MAETGCRHFNGYKPCGKNPVCERTRCSSFQSFGARVLIVHLEALGAVLRSTSLLQAVRERYPGCVITWVTKSPALLQNLEIERVLTLSNEDLLRLSALEFDVALVLDKSLVATGLLRQTKVHRVLGFRAGSSGAIVPANREAMELWQLGLSDELKFFGNSKSEQQLCHESLALGPYRRAPYQVALTREERELVRVRRSTWSPKGLPIIGINTGCAATLPAKKLSIAGHRQLILRILNEPQLSQLPIVLLGGAEDTDRNAAIARDLPVQLSPTTRGLRDGLCSVAACDLMFTGDSLGMHMGIGLGLWVVAWFGPSCAHEIDLYDRGVRLKTQAPCSPCWKRSCTEPLMCYDQVDFAVATQALAQGVTWLTSSSKPHIQETSSSVSL